MIERRLNKLASHPLLPPGVIKSTRRNDGINYTTPFSTLEEQFIPNTQRVLDRGSIKERGGFCGAIGFQHSKSEAFSPSCPLPSHTSPLIRNVAMSTWPQEFQGREREAKGSLGKMFLGTFSGTFFARARARCPSPGRPLLCVLSLSPSLFSVSRLILLSVVCCQITPLLGSTRDRSAM